MNHQYDNPPIQEAVCEIRFLPDQPWDIAIPGLLLTSLQDEYPRRISVEPGVTATLAVELAGHPQQVQAISAPEELRFWRESDDGVIRLRPHILAVSQYKPYPSWAVFRRAITQVLEAYQHVANPTGIQRIGLRYINEFDFDDGGDKTSIDLDEFFDLSPKVGERLRQDLSAFFVGIQYEYEDRRDSLRIQVQPVPTEGSGAVKISLDLDYFLNQPGEVAITDVGTWIEAAHERINESFEGCMRQLLRDRLGGKGA